MITPYKIMPIHASFNTNGKICTINQKIKRTHSALSRHNETLAPSKNRQEPRIYKPKTARFINKTQGLNLETPTKQVIQFSSFLTEGVAEKYRASNKSGSNSSKKKKYLSRKVLQKQLLQSYLDNIFERVSLVRASEHRRLSQTKRIKTRATLTAH